MCQGCQGPHKAQGSQALDPRQWQLQAQPTCLHRPPQAWEMCLCLHHRGSQALLAEVQGQGSDLAPGCNCSSSSGSGSSSVSQRCPGPHEGPRVEASDCQCGDGRTGVTPGLPSTWGWCHPVLFVQINLTQDLLGLWRWWGQTK